MRNAFEGCRSSCLHLKPRRHLNGSKLVDVQQVLKEELRKAEHLPDFHSVQLRLAVSDETEVTPVLNELASEVGSLVSVGSYPVRPCRLPRRTAMLAQCHWPIRQNGGLIGVS